MKYDKEQIKVRLRNMRKEWKAWTKVMNTAGFGWDSVEKIIRGDDKCWNAYIEVRNILYKKFASLKLFFQKIKLLLFCPNNLILNYYRSIQKPR